MLFIRSARSILQLYNGESQKNLILPLKLKENETFILMNDVKRQAVVIFDFKTNNIKKQLNIKNNF